MQLKQLGLCFVLIEASLVYSVFWDSPVSKSKVLLSHICVCTGAGNMGPLQEQQAVVITKPSL